MIEINLTDRQRELLRSLRESTAMDKRQYIDRAFCGRIETSDIEVLCRIINDEHLMHGIERNYNPNAYGRELEALLNAVNKPRLI